MCREYSALLAAESEEPSGSASTSVDSIGFATHAPEATTAYETPAFTFATYTPASATEPETRSNVASRSTDSVGFAIHTPASGATSPDTPAEKLTGLAAHAAIWWPDQYATNSRRLAHVAVSPRELEQSSDNASTSVNAVGLATEVPISGSITPDTPIKELTGLAAHAATWWPDNDPTNSGRLAHVPAATPASQAELVNSSTGLVAHASASPAMSALVSHDDPFLSDIYPPWYPPSDGLMLGGIPPEEDGQAGAGQAVTHGEDGNFGFNIDFGLDFSLGLNFEMDPSNRPYQGGP
ncbi:uncharacterized protein E0L32_005754 [Thyridium curvatum]|uniref:Uncharacterized protein n=1 Tax=Thyridium curvatum TaxID=1093900 RepID=A0A507BB34_9PEZI|nr:uncharacterized protein E0L32_005754 [Thyridium curvatum]TPX13810.1 hypothetical protein E0L32_005754 [Thyridium curvatum]